MVGAGTTWAQFSGPNAPRLITALPLNGLLLMCIGLVACVAPARSLRAYEGKAGATAKAALSAVETARLAAEQAGAGRALAPFLSVVVSEAEGEASSVQSQFDSIQPPDPLCDRLRSRLDELLTQAASTLGDLRIAVRRGELNKLPELAGRLAEVGR